MEKEIKERNTQIKEIMLLSGYTYAKAAQFLYELKQYKISVAER